MIKVFKNSNIYVHCPGGSTTGGIELLHQLVDVLRRNGLSSYIVYHGDKEMCSIPSEYSSYNIQTAKNIVDEKTSIEVFPETMYSEIFKHSNTQKFMWWLSVDNFFIPRKQNIPLHQLFKYYKYEGLVEMAKRPVRFILNRAIPTISMNDILNSCDLHGCQSAYAVDFLYKNGCKNNSYLKDYINVDHIGEITTKNREDIILYNPKKGIEFTQKLIKAMPDVNWVPIINMTRQEVIEKMKVAKLYIDFGNHPGKDRLPRECAINGCCVIVGSRGAASYFEDIPIDRKYKFNEFKDNISTITDAIRETLQNYDENITDFEYYRDTIRGEKAEFEFQAKRLFKQENQIHND